MPEKTIPVARPWLGEEEGDAAQRAILSGWVTQGPEVASFEREFAAAAGAAHACAVSSGTAALHLALRAVGVGPGDEVVTVSHSFIATANAVRYCGARPVFVDIDPATFNIDPAKAERAVSARTRAILCAHQMGMPCDMAAITALARRHGVAVVEDAACAVGSEILGNGSWEKIGRPHGGIACFSFHPRKLITAGEGGMLTTSDAELDARFRLWRQHGMSLPDTVRHASPKVMFEEYCDAGYNYRMTDIQAAVGRAQLRRLPAMVERRRQLAARYREGLSGTPLGLPAEPAWARTNWQSYCVRMPEGLGQRAAMQTLLEAGIATRRGVMCAHREPAWPRDAWTAPDGLEESERAQDRGIILPLYHQMTEAQQDRVIEALRALA